FPGGERIPIGIIYRTEDVPSYEEQVASLLMGPLAHQPMRVRPLEEYRELVRENL
ncbi:MAG: hypothetical protein H5T71_03065, partial [Chloroflexi bacterium]|nr:hypothetical protein [Chloroflexota bacterium]